MPIHCCAMQGRMDAIQALLFFDTEESIKRNLEMESEVLKNDNYLAFFSAHCNVNRAKQNKKKKQKKQKNRAKHIACVSRYSIWETNK